MPRRKRAVTKHIAKEPAKQEAPPIEVNTIRGFPITLPGDFVPEVKDKEILLIAKVGKHLSQLIEIRSLNPKFKETNEPFVEGDTPEKLLVFYCATEVAEDEKIRNDLSKVLEEASLRYFNKKEAKHENA